MSFLIKKNCIKQEKEQKEILLRPLTRKEKFEEGLYNKNISSISQYSVPWNPKIDQITGGICVSQNVRWGETKPTFTAFFFVFNSFESVLIVILLICEFSRCDCECIYWYIHPYRSCLLVFLLSELELLLLFCGWNPPLWFCNRNYWRVFRYFFEPISSKLRMIKVSRIKSLTFPLEYENVLNRFHT